MEEVYQKSLELHRKHGGKIEVSSKVLLDSRETLSLAYTPGVAQVSIEIGKNPELAYTYTLKKNTVAIISDGSAILGLGNLGALAAIPVMEGKAALFKQFGGVDAFPICLDIQDTEAIIETVKRIAPVFGGINLEDIAAPRCFEIERRLRAELTIPVMHDDQHGTATVVLAGLINALKLRNTPKEEVKIVMSGAGAAGTAIATLLLRYGIQHIIVCDRQGAIYEGREGLTAEKVVLASITNREKRQGNLSEMMAGADVFIGVSQANLLDEAMVRGMGKRPIIFAMANPVPEILPEKALAAGAFIIATGRSDYTNQINNSLAFPGIFRGALDQRIRQFTEAMFLRAAQAIADFIPDPTSEKILPTQFEMGLSETVAKTIF